MAQGALDVLLKLTAQLLGYGGEKARAFVMCPDYTIVNEVLKDMTDSLWEGQNMPTMLVSENNVTSA